MGLIDRIKACFGKEDTPRADPAVKINLDHMGLTVGSGGLHGPLRLHEVSPETKDFIAQLAASGNHSGHVLQRLYLDENPLRLVIIGRDYGKKDDGSRRLTDLLVTPEDLVLIDNKYLGHELEHYAQIAKGAKMNGSLSRLNSTREEQEIYGPAPGSDRSSECSYKAKILLNHLGKPSYKRVYQHCNWSDAMLGCGKIVTSGGITGVLHSKSIISEVEGQGISYAVLMPKASIMDGNQENQDYWESTLREEAKRSFLQIKGLIR